MSSHRSYGRRTAANHVSFAVKALVVLTGALAWSIMFDHFSESADGAAYFVFRFFFFAGLFKAVVVGAVVGVYVSAEFLPERTPKRHAR